jgi:hypothetical protein
VYPRTYAKTLAKKRAGGTSLVTLTLTIMAPAILAAAALRPRGSSGGQRRR